MPSELPFSICVTFSLPLKTMISLSVTHWLTRYSLACESKPFSSCTVHKAVQWLHSTSSHLSSLPIAVSLLLNCPSISPLLNLPIWCFSAVSLFFSCCSFFFPLHFSTPYFSFPTFACVYPSGTLHCINQGLSAPHSGYSISTHHLTKRQTDRQKEEKINIKFNFVCGTL